MNLDRSYLSMLESGKREVSNDVLKRAHSVIEEVRRLTPNVTIEDLDRAIEALDTDSLVSVFEHFVSRSNAAPLKAKFFYEFIRVRVMRQIALRFGIALDSERHQKRKKENQFAR